MNGHKSSVHYTLMSLSVLQFSICVFFYLFFWLLPNHWSKRKKQQVDTLSKLKETVFIRTFLPDKCKRFIDIRMINIWSSASTGILKSTETYKLRIYVISMNIYRLWGLAVIHSQILDGFPSTFVLISYSSGDFGDYKTLFLCAAIKLTCFRLKFVDKQ